MRGRTTEGVKERREEEEPRSDQNEGNFFDHCHHSPLGSGLVVCMHPIPWRKLLHLHISRAQG